MPLTMLTQAASRASTSWRAIDAASKSPPTVVSTITGVIAASLQSSSLVQANHSRLRHRASALARLRVDHLPQRIAPGEGAATDHGLHGAAPQAAPRRGQGRRDLLSLGPV